MFSPAPFRSFLLTALLAASITSSAATQAGNPAETVRRTNGTLVINRLFDGNVFETDFEFSVSPQRYRMRMLHKTPLVDMGVLIVSDYSDIYESAMIWGKDGQRRPVAIEHSVARISQGSSPRATEGIEGMQAWIAAHLYLRHLASHPAETNFPDALVPASMERRMKVERAVLRTETVTGTGTPTIRFWAADPTKPFAGFQDHTAIFLVAELQITEQRDTVPVRVTYTEYRGKRDPDTKLISQEAVVEYKFSAGPLENGPATDSLALSYGKAPGASVTDRRFSADKPLSYFLTEGQDAIPFQDATESYAKVTRVREARVEATHVSTRKRAILGAIGLGVALLGAVTTLKLSKRGLDQTNPNQK